MEHSAELDGELEMMSLERKAQEAELEAQGAQLKEAQKAASYVKSKEELGLRAAVEQVERTADEARKEAIADAAKAREEASEVRRAMQCEKEAFEKEVAKLREEASRTAQELSSAEQRSATLAEENRKLEAETFTCAREMEQRGEARQAEEVAALQAQLKEQKNLCANLAMEAKEWQLMAAQGESTMRQLQQRLDQAGSELTQARAELAESQAQHAILSEKLARSEKGAYTAEWMELAEHWEAEANSHLQEAVEAQRKLEQTKASLDVALSTSDAIKIEVEKEFARLTEEASVSEAKAATLEHEASLMKVFLIPYRCDPTLSHADPVFQVTIATLTAEQGHLKTQLDTVLAEARCAATAAADMGQAVAALSTHAGQPRRTPGQESASRARRCASPEAVERGDRLSLSLSALSASEEGSASAAVEDLGNQVRHIAQERDDLHGELATLRAGKATVESALVKMSSRVKELEAGRLPKLPHDERDQVDALKSTVAQLQQREAALQKELAERARGEEAARTHSDQLEERLRHVKAQCECLRLEIAQLENDRSEASALAKEATDTAAKAFEAQHRAETEVQNLRQQLAGRSQQECQEPQPKSGQPTGEVQLYEPQWMTRVGQAPTETTTSAPGSSFGTGFFMKSRFARTEEANCRIAEELSQERPREVAPEVERTAGEVSIAASPTLKQVMGLQNSKLSGLGNHSGNNLRAADAAQGPGALAA